MKFSADKLLAAIAECPEDQIREFARVVITELHTTGRPVWNDATGKEEDHGPRLLFDGESFPSGTDFIDVVNDALPPSIAEATVPR